jgi:hypothetical protein
LNNATVHCVHKEMVPLDRLLPHPRNPNQHSDHQVALLAKIIEKQGWRVPITVSLLSGFITRGHARLLAAKKLGLETAPVDFQKYDTEASELADMVADNRISELSDLSQVDVKAILLDLEKAGVDLELAGYDANAWDTLRSAFAPDLEMLPGDLPDPGIAGVDTSMGRLILVYRTPEEKKFWTDKLGCDGSKVIWTPDDFSS